MELACRAYMEEPAEAVAENTWPAAYDDAVAAPMRDTLRAILQSCLDYARLAPVTR
jgi:formiminoglutamase